MSDGLTEKFFSFDLNKSAAHLVKFKKFKKVLTNGLCSQKRVTYWVKKTGFFFEGRKID
jgi:hypothetical protein